MEKQKAQKNLKFVFCCFLMFFLFFLADSLTGQDISNRAPYSSIKDLMDRAEKKKEELKHLEENSTLVKQLKEKGKKDANSIYQYYKGDFQGEVKKYKAELKKIFKEKYGIEFKDEEKSLKKYYTDYWSKEQKGFFLSQEEKIYIFVSSGMGEDVVKAFVRDSSRLIYGDVFFVLRGGISGLTYLGPTTRWIVNILKVDSSCNVLQGDCSLYDREFLIDPLLFRKFDINKVPAVVYIKGNLEDPETVVISPGAVSLKRHLARITEALKARH